MSTQYAPFSSEDYNCLNPDLTGVEAAIELTFAEERVAAIEKEMATLVRSVPSRAQAIERIEKEVASISAATEDGRKNREAAVSSFVDAVRCQMQEEWNIRPIAAGRISRICAQIHSLYSTFDADTFMEHASKLLDEKEDTAESLIKQLKSEQDKIVKQIDKNWNGRRMAKFLRYIPDVWRDRKVTDTFKSEDMAIHILKSLVADWRNRSFMYRIPVTVGGYAIASLETSSAELWMDLYEKLGLKPGPVNRFRYRDAEHRGGLARRQGGLPGFFGGPEPGNGREVTDEELSRI